MLICVPKQKKNQALVMSGRSFFYIYFRVFFCSFAVFWFEMLNLNFNRWYIKSSQILWLQTKLNDSAHCWIKQKKRSIWSAGKKTPTTICSTLYVQVTRFWALHELKLKLKSLLIVRYSIVIMRPTQMQNSLKTM